MSLDLIASLDAGAPAARPDPPTSPVDPASPQSAEPSPITRSLVAVWLGVALCGVAALLAAAFEVGPPVLDGIGATLVVSALAWLLASRTSGRALVAAALAAGLGALAVISTEAVLPTGAAVLTCAVGGSYAVLATVPTTTFAGAVRELGVAVVISAVTALAALGFHPTVDATRFDMVSLIVGLVLCGAVVQRLGSSLHGLGRRGLIAVAAGVMVMIVTLAYAEVLQRYGAQGTVSSVMDFVDAASDRLGAFPRPLVVLVGVPALMWGSVLRSSKRQGWWVTMFGITATVPIAAGLVPPDSTFLEATLRALYSVALGVPLGWLVIRVDRALSSSGRSRGRRIDIAETLPSEPSRFAEL